MNSKKHQHMVATIFPASMLDTVRRQSQTQSGRNVDEIIFLIGTHSIQARRVRLIAEEFVRAGKAIRVVRAI